MYLSDMHTHSIASGHGTSCTISDMAKSASRKGLKLLGITDHGPATLAAGTASYFRSLTYSPRKRFNVELLYGIELNILDVNGKVDLEQELLEKLDYSIASIHAQNFHPASKEENTKAFLNVMKNPMVKILGHRFPAAAYDMPPQAAPFSWHRPPGIYHNPRHSVSALHFLHGKSD